MFALRPSDAINGVVLTTSIWIFYMYGKTLPEMSTVTPQPFPSSSPYGSIVPVHASYEVTKSTWPNAFGRQPEGGNMDALVTKVVEAVTDASKMVVRVDGDVVYENPEGEQFTVAVQTTDGTKHFEIPAGHAVRINADTVHSLPLGEKGELFRVTSRNTNGVTEIAAGTKYNPPIPSKETRKLNVEFSNGKLKLQTPTATESFVVYDVDNFDQLGDKMESADWPLITAHSERSKVDALEQEFTMEWVEEGVNKELLFKGLSGSLAGGEGRPGVIYNKSNGSIHANLLLSRPDGTFFIGTKGVFIMIVASPDATSGEPDKNSLRALKITGGVKLPAGWWHSVPIPLPENEKTHFYEKVASTNANIVSNVKEETGSTLQIEL